MSSETLAPGKTKSNEYGKSFANTESLVHQISAEREKLENSARRERFGWVMAVIFLLDLYFFENVGTAAAISLLIIQIIFILFLSEQSGVRSVASTVKNVSYAAAGAAGYGPMSGDSKDQKYGHPDTSENVEDDKERVKITRPEN